MIISSHNQSEIEVGMICTDIDGDRCIVDRVVDHKRAEVAFECNGSWSYEGDRVRMDELTPTGETENE